MKRRAVITGIGVVSALGHSPEAFLEALLEQRTGIKRVRAFPTEHFRSDFAGEIQDFSPETFVPDALRDEWNDRYLHLGIAAALQAVSCAGLTGDLSDRPDLGLVIGTCNGGLKTAEKLYRILHGKESGCIDEKMNVLFRYFAAGRTLGSALGISGPMRVVTTACASSTTAIGLALDLIHTGKCNQVILGGTDALCLTAYSGFSGIKAMTTSITAPFSTTAEYGLNLGEGAAFWVIETPESASKRKAEIFGEIAGYSLSADAHHATAPDPKGDGAYQAMRKALDRAGVSVQELDYINAHGTGTEANDRAESRAIKKLIADRSVPVSSTKSYLGHCLGSAGILEATAALLCMNKDVVPPTLNFTQARPGCLLDYVPNTPRTKSYSTFLKNSMAFGGNNAAVVIAKSGTVNPSAIPPDTGRPVITGCGAVCCLGLNLPDISKAVTAGKIGIQRITRFSTDQCKSHYAGLIPEQNWRRVDRRLNLSAMTPIARYGALAVKQALEASDQRMSPKTGKHTGLVLGVCVGPSEESLMDSVWSTADYVPDLANFSVIVANSVSGAVSRELYLKGYNTVLANGHQAGLAALIHAADAIRLGHEKCIVTGGVDELFARYFYNYDVVDYLAQGMEETEYGATRLPGQRRVLGEGAAMLTLETEKSSRDRNARILAAILGSASSFDAGPITPGTNAVTALIRAIELSIQRSNIRKEDIALILSAPQGNAFDERETIAVNTVFHSNPPPVRTTVFQTGYIESTSAVLNLALALNPDPLCPFPELREPGTHTILVLGTSNMGYNYSLVLEVFK